MCQTSGGYEYIYQITEHFFRLFLNVKKICIKVSGIQSFYKKILIPKEIIIS
jgi:hypothetical protein